MRDLLETLDAWRAEGTDAGRAVVVRTFGSAPRPEGAVLLVADDGRLMGSVSGGCVEGAAAEEIERAAADRQCPGDPLRHQRRGGLGRRSRLRRHDRCPGPARGAGRGRRPPQLVRVGPRGRSVAVATPLPADSPPAEFGPHQPGAGAPPAPPIVVGASGELIEGTTGDACDGRGPRRGRGADPRRRAVAHGRGRRPGLLRRGLSGPPAARRRRGGGGRPVARPLRARARLRDRRRRRARRVRDAGAVPGRRPDRRRLAGRGLCDARGRAERCRGDPVPRPEVRRAGDRRGDAPRLPLRRRGRLPQDAVRPARAAAATPA